MDHLLDFVEGKLVAGKLTDNGDDVGDSIKVITNIPHEHFTSIHIHFGIKLPNLFNKPSFLFASRWGELTPQNEHHYHLAF